MEYEKLFHIVIYSHFFKIERLTNKGKEIARHFSTQFILFKPQRQPNGKFKYSPYKVFAASNYSRSEFRFHINSLEMFKRFLDNNFIQDSLYTIEYALPNEYEVIQSDLNPNFALREHQVPASDFLVNSPNASNLLEFGTGRGKTITSLASVSSMKKRVLIAIRPGYIEKWIGDIQITLLEQPTAIMTAMGGDQLRGLIQLAMDNKLTAKYILISNKTLQNFISEYEENSEEFKFKYGLNYPEELFKLLKIGVRLVDEVHQEYHFNFKLDLYTHVIKSISLSATLIAQEEFLTRMFNIMYPKECRYNEESPPPFINVFPYFYNIKDNYKINTTRYGNPAYSHDVFEHSIMKYPNLLDDYLEMLKSIIDNSYIKNYLKGDKLIIFATSLQMVRIICGYLKSEYKHLDIRTYVENDPYENVIDADIRVTTIGSGGTAIDIPQLTTNIMTVAISSPMSNLQAIGRLRKIEGREVEFYYLVCNNIPKHYQYHENKKETFLKKIKVLREIFHNKTLG